MKLFVSYSRGDTVQVERLVRSLESSGHDVWLDVDDIVGSEQWRNSIVEGITAADAVIVAVSPRSMSSPNVEREITLAAEEQRRIVPIVLEHAQLAGGIRYVLAGVQAISFVDRPFEEAVAELEDELTGVRSRPRSSPAASRPATQRRRRLAVSVGVVVAAVVGALLWWNGRPPQSPEDEVPDVVLSGGAVDAVDLAAGVWFAGFEIEAKRAVFDPARHEVSIDATFTNTASASANPLEVLTSEVAALEWAGSRSAPFCACDWLAGGASEVADLTFSVDDGFRLADATLVFGGVDDHRASIPLDGSPAHSSRPEPLTVDGAIDDGAGTVFTVDHAEVVPAFCRGLADSVTFTPAPAGAVSVVVRGTVVTTDPAPGGVGFGEAHLVLPDGTVIGSTSLPGGVILLLQANQPRSDVAICMNLSEPPSGEYRLVVKASGVEPDPDGLRFGM